MHTIGTSKKETKHITYHILKILRNTTVAVK
jgi:hypothetical protein